MPNLKETMDKVADSITALEIKMMSNHKELMNKIENCQEKNIQSIITIKEKRGWNKLY